MNRDCAKEPKRRKSEAEDAQEGHLVGSQNENTLPDKNTSRKKHSPFSCLVIFMANQTDMPSTPRRKMVCIRQEFERLLRHPCCRNGPEMAPNAAPESSFFGCCCGLLACVLGRAYAHWLGAYHNASFPQVPVTPQGPRLFALETRRLVPGVRWSRALLPGFAPNWPLQGHRWSR